MIRIHANTLLAACAAAALAACQPASDGAAPQNEAAAFDASALEAVVAARGDEDKARDQWRHPVATLAFFGVKPDMTVVEALPGQGWYTRVVLPYVAEEGRFAGANYQDGMWPLILPNPTPELVDRLSNWTDTFPGQAAEWAATSEPVVAFEFGDAPDALKGEVDIVLMIRALHNFNRAGGEFGAEALADCFELLKPGGVLGVVQHRAPASATGAPADGSNGYITEANVIAMVEAAGFVFEEKSEINANPADQPGAEDIVWRLPPTFGLGDEGREAFAAIGESDRMTMRFRKPA